MFWIFKRINIQIFDTNTRFNLYGLWFWIPLTKSLTNIKKIIQKKLTATICYQNQKPRFIRSCHARNFMTDVSNKTFIITAIKIYDSSTEKVGIISSKKNWDKVSLVVTLYSMYFTECI